MAAKRRVSRRLDRPLTSEQIVEAGLSLLDQVGLTGFSTRALAERLGTYPATLYWHVGNRSRLLAAMVDRGLGELELLDPGSVPWQQWLRDAAREYRKVLHRHPNLGPVVATQLTVSVPGVRLVEIVLSVLEGAGFAGEDLADAYNTFVGSLIGWVSMELCSSPPDAERAWYSSSSPCPGREALAWPTPANGRKACISLPQKPHGAGDRAKSSVGLSRPSS